MNTVLLFAFCCGVLILLARIADNTKPPAGTFPCDHEGMYETLPGITREIERLRGRRLFRDDAAITRLEARHAFLTARVAETEAADRAEWVRQGSPLNFEWWLARRYCE